MQLKDKIKELCKERNISMRKLEIDAGISPRTIQHWNTSTPSADKLISVAKVLNVPVAELLADGDPVLQRIADVEKEKMSVDAIAPSLEEKESVLLLLYRLLNDDGQRQLLDYANLLVDSERYKRYTEDMYSSVS